MTAYEDRAPQGNPAITRPARVDTAEGSRAQRCVAGLRRRGAASWRLPVLECGRPDPWNYDELPLTDKQVKGARAAAEHLLACDLTPLMDVDTLRALWRAGHRELAAELARSAVEL